MFAILEASETAIPFSGVLLPQPLVPATASDSVRNMSHILFLWWLIKLKTDKNCYIAHSIRRRFSVLNIVFCNLHLLACTIRPFIDSEVDSCCQLFFNYVDHTSTMLHNLFEQWNEQMTCLARTYNYQLRTIIKLLSRNSCFHANGKRYLIFFLIFQRFLFTKNITMFFVISRKLRTTNEPYN